MSYLFIKQGKPTFPGSGANPLSRSERRNTKWGMAAVDLSRGFKSLTFSPFIITRHSLGVGFATDGEGREGRVWLTINLSKLEMSRPTQPLQGAAGALISPLSRPLTPPSLYFHRRALLHLSRCLPRPLHPTRTPLLGPFPPLSTPDPEGAAFNAVLS